jgi:hypothetical protein
LADQERGASESFMAREESDREDLIREATALVERIEYEVAFLDETVVVGFRRDGAISFFFGQKTVFQFNADNELRRGFSDGSLLKAERGKLVRLTRNRTETEIQLVRHPLSDSEETAFLSLAAERIGDLKSAINSKTARVLRSVSSEPTQDVGARVIRWLNAWQGVIKIASTARLVHASNASKTSQQ